MKKTRLIFTSLLIAVLCIASISFPVYANTESNFSSLIETQKQGLMESRYLSSADIKQIQLSQESGSSDSETKLKEIFSAMSFQLNNAQFAQVQKVVALSDIGNIRVNTAYVKVDENGQQTLVSEQEAMKEARSESLRLARGITEPALSPAAQLAAEGGHSGTPVTSPDGYMKMQIAVIYTPNYHGTGTTIGRYVVLGSCQWLKYIVTRAVDAIALMAKNFSWDNIGYNSYALLATYNRYEYLSGQLQSITPVTESKDESQAMTSVTQGVFFEYNLPNNAYMIGTSYQYSDFAFLITGIGSVDEHHNPDKEITVGFQYVHARNALSISPTYTFGTGLSLDVSGLNIPEYYSTAYRWYYWNDYYS